MTWLATDDVFADGTMISRIKPGPWEIPAGNPVAVMIRWIGDTLFHRFEDPDDWPELSPRIVEDFNRPYRAVYNEHLARAAAFSAWDDEVWAKHDRAGWEMERVRQQRENPGARRLRVKAFGIEGGVVHG